jgi:predicted nuclease with TOPRIM domain
MLNSNEGDVQEDIKGSNDQEQVEEKPQEAAGEGDELTTRVATLEAELEKARNNLQAARRFEKESKLTKAELETQLREQGKYKELYEQVIQRENSRLVDEALTKALEGKVESHNMKAVASKLIDRSAIAVNDGMAHAESVEAAIAKAKEEFPTHFIKVETPTPKRAAEGAVTGGFAKELAEARKQGSGAYQDFLRRNKLI